MKVINAGSGKKKKKKKLELIIEITGNYFGFKTPFDDIKEHLNTIESFRESTNVFKQGTIKNKDKYKKIAGEPNKPFFLLQPTIFEKLFEGSKYNKREYKNSNVIVYEIGSIPNLPQIEYAYLYLPTFQDNIKFPYKRKGEALFRSLQNHISLPGLSGIWNAITQGSPNHFNLQVFFKADKKAQIREGLYIPLFSGDIRIPDKTVDNSWHIFYAKYYAKDRKSELYLYETINGPVEDCYHGNKICTPLDHFEFCFKEAVKKYGGAK